jgi:hypothetical protein
VLHLLLLAAPLVTLPVVLLLARVERALPDEQASPMPSLSDR